MDKFSPDHNFANVGSIYNNYDLQNYCHYSNYGYDHHQPSRNYQYYAQLAKDKDVDLSENSHHWVEYVSKMKEAQRAKLIEQLHSLPETGITLPPPSESSNLKAAKRPGYIKRPLNAFMIFSKIHRFIFISKYKR